MMKIKQWICAFMLLLLCTSVSALADTDIYLDFLTQQYGEPTTMSENVDVYDDGITICFFPGEGIVILYKESENSGYLKAWEILHADALDNYVAGAIENEPIKTVYIDFSDMSAKQYPDDFTVASVPDAEKYSDYETFLNVLIGIDADDSRETATKDATSWGTWSGWSTTKVTSDSNTQVEKKTQYRSRSIYKNQDYSSWSGWSDWSTTAITASSTQDVQIEYRHRDQTMIYSDWSAWSSWSTKQKTISDSNSMQEETASKAHWWAARCNACGRHNPYWGKTTKCKGCGVYLPKGSYSNASYYSDDKSGSTLDGRSNGRTYNGKNYWYDEMRTVYRYRTRTASLGWGTWSNWSSTATTATSAREVQIRYRYRTRKLETKITYGKWSEWTDSWIGENSDRDVETRTVYRYRKSK